MTPVQNRRPSLALALGLIAAFGLVLPVLTGPGVAGQAATPPATASPVAAAAAPRCADGTAGAVGVGDPYFPRLGNGGYDVQHYDLDLDLDVATGAISDGRATITALATLDLCAFNLDFAGPAIDAVAVDGAPAAFARRGAELTITPAAPIAGGAEFRVAVAYRGVPGAPPLGPASPPGAEPAPAIKEILGEQYGEGWSVGRREIFVAGQPRGAEVWYPVNGHPADKATYRLRLTVPKPFAVVANGTLVERIDEGTATTSVWAARDPIASYLVTLHAGELVIEESTGPGGLTIRNAFAAGVPAAQRRVFDRMPAMIAAFEPLFGPYPFEVAGNTVVGEPLGFALETQTIATFGRLSLPADAPLSDRVREQLEGLIAHELAHQWFGNSVGLARWGDIWLNEGFATYAEALWLERSEGPAARDLLLRRWDDRLRDRTARLDSERGGFLDARQVLDAYRRRLGRQLPTGQRRQFLDGLGVADERALRDVPPERALAQLAAMGVVPADLPGRAPLTGDPGPGDLFDGDAVYLRGALTLHALRREVGDEAFFAILRAWTDRYRNGVVGTADFVALAEDVSGRDLDPFFDAWLYQAPMPALPFAARPLVEERATPTASPVP